jgi:isovaleryl-CoA dehydrogenase
MNSICNFSEEELELQSVVQDWAQKRLAPMAHELDVQDRFPREIWPELGELGLLGICCPTEYGGTGLGHTASCIAMEEMSRAAGGVGLSYGAHTFLCVNVLMKNGTEAQKQKFLPKLCSGEFIGALAMSEPGAGSDVVSMKTKAEKKGNKYILNGSKMWITNGSEADVLVVYAKTEPSKHQKGITAFLVEKGTKGFSVAQKLDKLGMRGSPTAELVFEDCEIPEENVLGEVNKGVYVLMGGLDVERLVLSAGPMGIMQNAMDITMDYVRQREQFGQKIGEFQLMQGKMAQMYTTLQSSRAFLYSLARQADQGSLSNTDCAALIYQLSENAVNMSLEAIQSLGGNGYINEYPTGRLLRDAKLYTIGAGTNEIRLWLIGRELMKNYP